VTESHVRHSGKKSAHIVALDATHAHGFVTAGVEKCWSRFDDCGGEMHDVFIVISEGGNGEHIARTVHAASEDDARQTHREIYADEPIVAVRQ
jgi:phosphoheptose isomerase